MPIFNNIARHLVHKINLSVFRNPAALANDRWFADHGDSTHRVNYDLRQDSLVFDLGGYKGQWASDIYSRYCCFIHVFEPVDSLAGEIALRFARNEKITIRPFGLADRTRKERIALAADGSSIYRKSNSYCDISLVRAADYFAENKIDWVDLVKINIEGGEYELLEHLIQTDIVRKIGNIQVQFHLDFPHAKSKCVAIQQELSKTHEITYQYYFTWENWRIKTSLLRR